MPDSGVNLIFQGQLQKKRYALKIILAKIEIGPNKVLAKLIENNFNIFNIISFQLLLFLLAGINLETFKLWHSRLGHLRNQNILCLITMSKRIDLSKSPPIDAYPLYSKAKMYDELYQDKIKFGQFSLDLIHSDVSGSYLPSYLRAKDYITFFDNYDKTSKVVLLLSQNRVLSAFNLF